jgi:type II secretory ATPase GspE/PulE/Tfp pilus assembly ATPase PilB-like protein
MSFMGVESFLLADAVNLIIAQRLIRTICTACKKEVLDLDDSVYKKLGIDRSVKFIKGKDADNVTVQDTKEELQYLKCLIFRLQ